MGIGKKIFAWEVLEIHLGAVVSVLVIAEDEREAHQFAARRLRESFHLSEESAGTPLVEEVDIRHGTSIRTPLTEPRTHSQACHIGGLFPGSPH